MKQIYCGGDKQKAKCQNKMHKGEDFHNSKEGVVDSDANTCMQSDGSSGLGERPESYAECMVQ